MAPDTPAGDSSGAAVPTQAFGVDVGGSGIKGGVVDLTTGDLVGERFKVLTPQPSTPEAVVGGIKEVVDHFGWTGPVGVTLPSVVSGGVVRTAANIDKGWIGTDPYPLLASTSATGRSASSTTPTRPGWPRTPMGRDATGRPRHAAHLRHGIGSAILFHGNLVPNTELGHMEVGGKEAEHQASSKVKDDKEMSYEKWAKHVSTVLNAYENLFWPDLFIVGGGISRKADKWVPHLTVRTPVVPATLQNTAGIVGAAMAVTAGLRP